MAVRALTVGQTFEYVLNADPAKKKSYVDIDPNDATKGAIEQETIGDDATIFGLKSLDVFLMAHIYDNASILSGRQGSDDVDIKTRMGQTNLEAVRFGLAYFKNFIDANGREMSVEHEDVKVNGHDYRAATRDTLNLLGIKDVTELAEKIKEKSEISRDEEKKSAGRSLRSG